MSESITKELRSAAVTRGAIRIDAWGVIRIDAWDSTVVMSESKRDDIADRIDARFTHELQAKQEEIDGLRSDNADLQARLDASIPLPVDADGVPWTCADVDKSFQLTDGHKATEVLVREIAYDWPHDGWWIVDQYDTHHPADKCRHVTQEPPDSQERIDADARKGACEYFGHSGRSCIGCPADGGTTLASCVRRQMSDLLRRQRELDGVGETR